MSIVELIVVALMMIATVFIVATVFALWRSPDNLTRINVMGATTCVALPLLIVAATIHEFTVKEFDPIQLLRAIGAILGLWIVVSVGSFYMGRSVWGITVTDLRRGSDKN